MSLVYLDMGFGEQCQNSVSLVHEMIDTIKSIDTGRNKIVFKWQLFKYIDGLEPLQQRIFDEAYFYARKCKYQTTSSVFDEASLNFLLSYEPSGLKDIKIACQFDRYDHRRNVYELIKKIPEGFRVIASIPDKETKMILKKDYGLNEEHHVFLCNVPEYPSTEFQYKEIFDTNLLLNGISDHTKDFNLFNFYRPRFYECHVRFSWYNGKDAGLWARTIEQLKEIL